MTVTNGRAEAEATVPPANTHPPDSDNPTDPPPLPTCTAVPVAEGVNGRVRERAEEPFRWKLMATETLTILSGVTISANGGITSERDNDRQGGGGSGGSLRFAGNNITNNGTISATGGTDIKIATGGGGRSGLQFQKQPKQGNGPGGLGSLCGHRIGKYHPGSDQPRSGQRAVQQPQLSGGRDPSQ